MSRAHPHGFPDDTPEPVAPSCSAIDELLQLIVVWLQVAAACCLLAAALAVLFPDFLLTLFR